MHYVTCTARAAGEAHGAFRTLHLDALAPQHLAAAGECVWQGPLVGGVACVVRPLELHKLQLFTRARATPAPAVRARARSGGGSGGCAAASWTMQEVQAPFWGGGRC